MCAKKIKKFKKKNPLICENSVSCEQSRGDEYVPDSKDGSAACDPGICIKNVS